MSKSVNPTTARLYTALGFGAVSLAIGIWPFAASEFFGKLYGLEAVLPSAVGYQQALGVRDATLGFAYIVSYFRRDTSAIETLLISQGFYGLGDALVLWLNDGDLSKLPSHLVAGAIASGIGIGFRYYWKQENMAKKD